jgi:hypothetical protein
MEGRAHSPILLPPVANLVPFKGCSLTLPKCQISCGLRHGWRSYGKLLDNTGARLSGAVYTRHWTRAANVVRQQLSIGQTRTVPQKHHPAKVLDDLAHLARHHVVSFVGVALYPYYYPLKAV